MQEAGTALHLARSGRLIVKAQSQVRDGTLLVDENGRRTGKVMETIGSVTNPFLSVQPMTDRIDRIIGTKLFVFENTERRSSPKPSDQFRRNKSGKGKSHSSSRPRNSNDRRSGYSRGKNRTN